VISKRDVREKTARLILQIAQHGQVLDAIPHSLDVTVQHRAVAADPEPVRDAMHLDPVFRGELLVGDIGAHGLAEHLGPAAGQRIESGFAQRNQDVLDGHLVDACDVRDLDRGKCLDVDVRMALLEAAEHVGVVLQAGLHVEAADDVELPGQATGRVRLLEHLFETVMIRPIFLWQARERAEYAGRAQIADVGRIYVLVRGEGYAIAVLRAVHLIGERSQPYDVWALEQRKAVSGFESRARGKLVACDAQCGIGDERQVHRHSRVHAACYPSKRRIARLTLWPPKPKLLLSAAVTGRVTATLGVKLRSSSGSGCS